MNRISAFAVRNIKELLRDPLSYIFCLGFPLVMLVVMTLVNDTIPPEANMTTFRIDNLCAGIAVFGLSFVMLFSCLNVTKDRSGAFLVRMYATPMRSPDFIIGYMLPVVVLSVAQIIITFAVSYIISLIVGIELNLAGILLAVVTLIPSAVLFIAFGLLFGSLFNEKASPGLCSIVISLASFLGGIFFDAEGAGGILFDICKVLPFWHSTAAARCAVALNFEGYAVHLLITLGYAVVLTVIASLVFKTRMKADLA
ncbi:MAG: ABC transporter permease [Oscillospiraceae bacterium]